MSPSPDELDPTERAALTPYFTDLDGPVFALTNLPEVVKGALFARYSRSPKSLRRLYLDEFHEPGGTPVDSRPGTERADRLYARVFNEYGDDSVAQLGAAHLACEGASNVLTKILERGRLMAYLEQSTRYIPYSDKPRGRWRYAVPAELERAPLRDRYTATLDAAFETYARWIDPLCAYYRRQHAQQPGDSDRAYRAAIRAKALDTLRGLLPAATQSNVGIFGSGQAYEALLLRLRSHPLAEARDYGARMLVELRKVIPAFLTRVDRPDRGERGARYLAETRTAVAAVAERLLADVTPESREEVRLTDFDPDGEVKVVAAALYPSSRLPDDQLMAVARRLTTERRLEVLRAYVGSRQNRRHRPGRAFERTSYRFDFLCDYGAFRDLQRHRLLTIEWQALSPDHGYTEPAAIAEVGAGDDWQRVLTASASLHEALRRSDPPELAQYAVSMAFRVRFYMDMSAREAMHVLELRSGPQGHPTYRRVSQECHRLIAEQAGHRAIAAAMSFVDHSAIALERLGAERAAEARRQRS